MKLYIAEFMGKPGDRNHQGIFIPDDNDENKGTLYHVIGFKINMKYEKKSMNLTKSEMFIKKELIGNLNDQDFNNFEKILESVPPPKGKPTDKKFKDCQDWVIDTIKALNDKKLLI